MRPTNPITTSVHCQLCGHAVSLTFQPKESYRLGAWSCPHAGCGRVNHVDLPGTILRVTADYALVQ
jgi:hypothetical protein